MKLKLGLVLLPILALVLGIVGCNSEASGVNLVATMHGCGGSGGGPIDSDATQHFDLGCETIICNQGNETANDVRVFVDTSVTNEGLQTLELEPRQKQKPIIIKKCECETFAVNWGYDCTEVSHDEVYQSVNQYVLHVTWIDRNGKQVAKVICEGGSP
jgi:hypothetical protein